MKPCPPNHIYTHTHTILRSLSFSVSHLLVFLVAESDTLTFVGGTDRDVEGQLGDLKLGDLKLDLSVYYRVRVKSQLEGGEMINAPSTLCSSGIELCESL